MTTCIVTNAEAAAAVETLKTALLAMHTARAAIHPDVLAELDVALNTIKHAAAAYLPEA